MVIVIALAYWLIGILVIFTHNWMLCGGRPFAWSVRSSKWWWFFLLAFLWPVIIFRFGK